MKILAFAALSVFTVFASASALADTQSGSHSLTQVEQYNRHKGIDVAKVTGVTTAQDPEKVDGLVKSTMTYVDGSGIAHSLEYTTMGYGRQNG